MNTNPRTVNATFSLPVEVYTLLHGFVEKRGLSRFVSEAIRNALQSKQSNLRQAYLENNQDELMQRELKDWDNIQAEGWDE
ncbi:MAG: hypothetical protein WCK42_07350 [Myxococcaceae bacterium]